MQIKKRPESKRVKLSNISRGECFMLLEDFSIDEDECLDEFDLLLCIEYDGKDKTKVVELEHGCIYSLPNTLTVEKIKAHIVCE